MGLLFDCPDPQSPPPTLVGGKPRTRAINGWCAHCKQGWNSRTLAHCAACCRSFGTDRAFDLHQRLDKHGKVICRDPKKIKDKHGQPKMFERDSIWRLAGNNPWGANGNRGDSKKV